MSGSPEELLRGALEKIVFFECRVDQLNAELVAARSAAARAHEAAASSRRRETELESALAQARGSESQASAERAELIDRVRLLEAERERFLSGMVERARVSGAPTHAEGESGEQADLAGFIAELRAEIVRLHAWKAAAQAAGYSGDDLGGTVQREPTQLRSLGAAAEAVPALAARFEQAGRIGVSQNAARALPAGLATRSERALYEGALDDLASADPAVRRRAAGRLQVLGARSSAPLVAAALGREPEAEVKVALLAALAAVPEPGAADLVTREIGDARPAVRAAALDAVYSLAGANAVPRLTEAFADVAPLVRRRAALLLGFCQTESAEDALAAALSDRDAGVARAAAAALSGRPSAKAQAALVKALARGPEAVRATAARGVARWAAEKVDASAPDIERRAAARRISERLRELDPAALRGAVTKVSAERSVAPVRARAVAPNIAVNAPAPAVAPAAPAAATARAPQPKVATRAVATRTQPSRAVRAAAGSQPARSARTVATATLAPPAPALSEAVMVELRGALRGRTPSEVADALAAPVQEVEAALRTLVAQGAAVPRGPRFYVS